MNSKFKIQDLSFKSACETPLSKWSFAIVFFVFGCFAFVPSAADAQETHTIAEIQGDKNVSPFNNKIVRTSGIMTAKTRTGFFIQTPDDKTDKNPATSEGIFVYMGAKFPTSANVGDAVTVTGYIDEYRPEKEPNTLSITELKPGKNGTVQVDSKTNALPKPIVLTVDDFKPNLIDELEKYEGMRVTAPELTVVAPTGAKYGVDEKTGSVNSDGAFYGVVKGLARPYRAAGFDIYQYLFLPDKDKTEFKKNYPKMTMFGHNPERLRIESTEQIGAEPIDVAANATITNLTGVIDYGYSAYTILPDADSKPVVNNSIKAIPLPAPSERQFSVASMNVERFFDDEDDPGIKEPIISSEGFERRLKKVSMAVRDYLQMPDVIGVVEMESLPVLKKLAERINKDAVASGKPDPKYQPYLVEGNDIGGIDSGFLVKSSRVDVIETKQFGKDEKFRNPVSGQDVFLNDRPPLMLRAAIKDAKLAQPFEFTVIINHLKSLRGYNDEKDAPFVRMKKRLQAEFLAKYVQERLKANSGEKIALVGDFNAFQFSDGITDIIGTLKGSPLGKDAVQNPSDDLLNPDLVDLVDTIKPNQQYSYSFDGNAQVLDHFLVNDNFKRYVKAFGYARVNADFPEIYRNDANRVERYSDHDAAIAYFNLDEPK